MLEGVDPVDLTDELWAQIQEQSNLYNSTLGVNDYTSSIQTQYDNNCSSPESANYHPSLTNQNTNENRNTIETEEVPPSLFLRSPEKLEKMSRILEEKGITPRKEGWRKLTERVRKICDFATKEQKRTMVEEFKKRLNVVISGCDLIDMPMIIWDRTTTVHFYNQSFSAVSYFIQQFISLLLSINYFHLHYEILFK